MARLFRLKNMRNGNEFNETESGYKLRMKNPSMMDGIRFIGIVNPETGEIEKADAIDHIENTNIIKLNENESGEHTEEINSESEEGSEKGGDIDTEKQQGKIQQPKRKSIFPSRK